MDLHKNIANTYYVQNIDELKPDNEKQTEKEFFKKLNNNIYTQEIKIDDKIYKVTKNAIKVFNKK
jgi:hypothetical protein